MNHIFSQDKIYELLETLNENVVVVGGCFDILHHGHLEFLKAAKIYGESLIVLLESDEQIKKMKGDDRPKNPQIIRAENLLKETKATDVILLNGTPTNRDYDEIVSLLKPAIIATTENDPFRFHKDRQAKLVGGTVKEVVKRIEDYSTTKIIGEKHD